MMTNDKLGFVKIKLFPTLDFSKDKYRETIEPMLTIASNNGFRYMEE
jgi:hypothetical protein